MKTEFASYLTAINVPSTFMARIDSVLSDAQFVCPDEISAMFISDYLEESGTREFQSLFFFTENYVLEAKSFVSHDDLDISFYKNNISYLTLKKQAYDLKNPTDGSRLYMKVYLGTTVSMGMLFIDLKASRENCQFLVEIFKNFVQPNMYKP